MYEGQVLSGLRVRPSSDLSSHTYTQVRSLPLTLSDCNLHDICFLPLCAHAGDINTAPTAVRLNIENNNGSSEKFDFISTFTASTFLQMGLIMNPFVRFYICTNLYCKACFLLLRTNFP